MDFQFENAAPVNRAEINPFAQVVADIAGKTGDKGKPLARSFKVSGEHATKKSLDKFTKQLQSAGDALTPPVTVRVSKDVKEDPKTKVASGTVTFWTVPKIIRKSKPATPAA